MSQLIKKYRGGYSWSQVFDKEEFVQVLTRMNVYFSYYLTMPDKVLLLCNGKKEPTCIVELKEVNGSEKVISIKGLNDRVPTPKDAVYLRDVFLGNTQYILESSIMKLLYFYKDGLSELDLLKLNNYVNFVNPINLEDRDLIGGAIVPIKNVVFKDHATLSIDHFSQRKNWHFEKTLTLVNVPVDKKFILNCEKINCIQIKTDYIYNWDVEDIVPDIIRQEPILLKNVQSKLLQISGDHFKFNNDFKIDVLELDVKIINFGCNSINCKKINFWNNQTRIINQK